MAEQMVLDDLGANLDINYNFDPSTDLDFDFSVYVTDDIEGNPIITDDEFDELNPRAAYLPDNALQVGYPDPTLANTRAAIPPGSDMVSPQSEPINQNQKHSEATQCHTMQSPDQDLLAIADNPFAFIQQGINPATYVPPVEYAATVHQEQNTAQPASFSSTVQQPLWTKATESSKPHMSKLDYPSSPYKGKIPGPVTSRPVKLGFIRRRNNKAKHRSPISRGTKRPYQSISPDSVTLKSITASVFHDSSTFDVQREFNLLDTAFKPASEFAQRKQADLQIQMRDLVESEADVLRQLKQLQADEKKYYPSSVSGNIDKADNTVLLSEASIDSSVLRDSEESADHKSTLPTSQQTESSTMSGVEDASPTSSHETCVDCGYKTLYSCTYSGCGYGTHSLSDWKRHEVGQSHWPQYGYMCLDCLDLSGDDHDQSCRFCRVAIDTEPSARTKHYVLCETARAFALTFSRKDHLTDHRRASHGKLSMTSAEEQDVKGESALWKYPINSKWPRQCGFCTSKFAEWDERVKHVADHFRNGSTIEQWRLPSPPSDDDTHGAGPAPKNDDDDEDDDDDTPSENKGRFTASNPTHRNQQQSSSKQPSSSNKSSTTRTQGTQDRQWNQHRHQSSQCSRDIQDLPDNCESSQKNRDAESTVRIAVWLADTNVPFCMRTATVRSSRIDVDMRLRDFDRLFEAASFYRSGEAAASFECWFRDELYSDLSACSAQPESASSVVELPLPSSMYVSMSMSIRNKPSLEPDSLNRPSSTTLKLAWVFPIPNPTTTSSPPVSNESTELSCWQPRTKLMAPYYSFTTRLMDRAIQETARVRGKLSRIGARN